MWLGGSPEDAAAIAGALPAAEDAAALGSDVSKMHVLRIMVPPLPLAVPETNSNTGPLC